MSSSVRTIEATLAIPVSTAAVFGALPHILTVLSILWVLVRLAQEPLVQVAAKKVLSSLGITLARLEQLRGLWDRFSNIWRP